MLSVFPSYKTARGTFLNGHGRESSNDAFIDKGIFSIIKACGSVRLITKIIKKTLTIF